MNQVDETQNPRVLLMLALVFLVLVLGGIVDLVMDRPDSLLSAHVMFEVGLIGVSLGAASYLARGWLMTFRHVRDLEQAVEARQVERDAWRDRAGRVLSGFGAAIGAQFDDWRLTPAERATALMLLQGLSLKRIARMTDRSERTVRQHAVSVYRKSGVGGRAELAGFFLGDLLLPEESRHT